MKTFTQATAACQQMGGFLVEPRTEEISKAMRAFNFHVNLWIGLRDNAKNRNFLWQTNNASLSYTNWDPKGRQPNNLGGNQHCVAITQNYKWDDIDCGLEQEFVCQPNRGE